MFEIILVNTEFGQVLNEYGDLYSSGETEFRPQFISLEDALKEKNRLLKEYIYAGVIIRDIESSENIQEHYNEELGPKFSEEKQESYKWVHLPFYKRIFTKKPVFKYYDCKH